MLYVPRKILYPLFVLLFIVIFFSIISLMSFSQSLNVRDTSVEVVGDKVIFKATIENVSNHIVEGVTIVFSTKEKEVSEKVSVINPNESLEVAYELPFSEDLKYDVYISSPFNRPINLFFELDETTVKPVKAEVNLAKGMVVGNKYDMVVRLCNESQSDLFDVYWVESVQGSFFEEPFFPRTVSLRVNECKNLYSTLTPISPGVVKINFTLRVGQLEQENEYVVNISSE
jgi:hypothetical protein